ncbi:MAG: aldehyde reductase [Bacteroidota bacterium]
MNSHANSQVLVTGGTGFLGAHCVHQLLDKGYRVKTTLRSLGKKQQVIEALKAAGITAAEKLTFMEADLSKDHNWEEATKDCDYVLHVASPLPIKMPKDENVLIRPAVEGTLRVLEAAAKMGVKRVVMTSSFAAIGYSHKDESKVITEADWTDPKDKSLSAYSKSKTLAEQAAWDFIKRSDQTMELVTICPRYILGPALGQRFTTSLTVLKNLFEGTMKAMPNVSYGIIDVRDVADLHIRAMTHPAANNQRFLASSGAPMTFKEIALLLKDKLGDKAHRVSTRVYPNWLIRMAALFDPAAKGVAPHLGKTLISDNEKATKLLGWQPRSREAAILASIECILKYKD